jgi:hypothetical protein
MENTQQAQVTMCLWTGERPLSPTRQVDEHPDEPGCFNEEANKVTIVNETWSDTNLTYSYPIGYKFKRLICRNCRGIKFEVLSVDDYETAAKCCNCNMYYIVHSG